MPFYSLSTPQVRDRHLGLHIYIYSGERERERERERSVILFLKKLELFTIELIVILCLNRIKGQMRKSCLLFVKGLNLEGFFFSIWLFSFCMQKLKFDRVLFLCFCFVSAIFLILNRPDITAPVDWS